MPWLLNHHGGITNLDADHERLVAHHKSIEWLYVQLQSQQNKFAGATEKDAGKTAWKQEMGALLSKSEIWRKEIIDVKKAINDESWTWILDPNEEQGSDGFVAAAQTMLVVW